MQFLRTLCLTLLLLAPLLLAPLPVLAYDILLLQSLREKGYDEAVQGVKRECSATMRTVVLSDYAETDITRIIREEHPRLIIAVGDRALDVAGKQRTTPVLYMMALHARSRQKSVTGVGMLFDPARYLSVFESIGSKRVGVVCDPAKSGAYLKKALVAAKRSGIELVVREVHSPRETLAMLESLRGKVDAIWMLPDITAVSPETTEAYFLFSQGERVPLVSFSEVYLKMGGAVALGIDRFDIGKQLGVMAESVLAGTPVEELSPQTPRRIMLKVNDGVLRRLKITLAGGG
jgi:putative tryptophan/tyrosine transport system substrate-binding protein